MKNIYTLTKLYKCLYNIMFLTIMAFLFFFVNNSVLFESEFNNKVISIYKMTICLIFIVACFGFYVYEQALNGILLFANFRNSNFNERKFLVISLFIGFVFASLVLSPILIKWWNDIVNGEIAFTICILILIITSFEISLKFMKEVNYFEKINFCC